LPLGCYFWLDPKVTKKSSQQQCFFAAHGLCAAKQANQSCDLFAHVLHRPRFSKNSLCSATRKATIVCLLSGEAAPLTGRKIKNFVIANEGRVKSR